MKVKNKEAEENGLRLHYKETHLGNLLHIYNILCILGIRINNLCAPCNLIKKTNLSKPIPQYSKVYYK
jgi:hypothetical protein